MARKPRLLVLITLAEVGGAQTSVSLLLPAVAERFEVTLAAHGDGPLREAAARTGVTFVPLRHVRRSIDPWHDALGLVELVGLCRRVRPDVVHAHSSKVGILGRLAAALARVPVRIYTVHGWSFAAYGGAGGRLYLWLERLVRPLTTAIVCVSESAREQGLAAQACDRERSIVIHNGVDVESFTESPRHGAPPRIVSVGRFAYPKDFATLVEALERVDGDYRAWLVGEGPLLPEVEEALGAPRLAERVQLLGSRDDVPGLLAASEVFVLSSRSEGFPVSIVEAMAAGLPVVASDVGGVAEAVADGETGLLVPPGDPAALAEAVGRLLGDVELRQRLGAAGRARARACFDLPGFRAAHLELYRRELERRHLPAPASGQEPAVPVLSASARPGE
jgi:glycosyltransferase involved in cell wall biosynthesis